MKITKEISLDDFEAWGGAVDVLKSLVPETFDILSNYLNEVSEMDSLDETAVNDFLWFEAEDFLADFYEINLDGTKIEEDWA